MKCWSWLHRDDDVEAVANRRTCEAHQGEEQGIADGLVELGELRACIEKFEQVREQAREQGRTLHPDAAKELQTLTSRFLVRGRQDAQAGPDCRPSDLRRTDEDLDVAIYSVADAQAWYASVVSCVPDKGPLRAHLEVAYAGTRHDVIGKFDEQLTKLDRTIEQAVQDGERKVWTGMVCLGPGWQEHRDRLAQAIHEHYDRRSIERVATRRGDRWWPFPDAVVLPGVMMKKHDLFVIQSEAAERWPAWLVWPTDADDPEFFCRPFAIARAFLHSFLDQSNAGRLVEGEVFPAEAAARICGPRPLKPRTTDSASWDGDVAGVSVRDNPPTALHHATRCAEQPWQVFAPEDRPRCARGSSFILACPRVVAGRLLERRSGLLAPFR